MQKKKINEIIIKKLMVIAHDPHTCIYINTLVKARP